jgi:hypothetical protein
LIQPAFGVSAFGASRAYPLARILSAKLIEDRLGTEPILLVLGTDGKSIRAFQARLPGQTSAPKYYQIADRFVDSETGSEWNFSGCAVKGKSAGSCLTAVYALKDYRFDWRNYHPDTTIFKR